MGIIGSLIPVQYILTNGYCQCIGFGAIKSLKSKSNPKNLRILIGFLNLGKGSDLIWIWRSKSNQIIKSNLASGHQRSDFADALRSAVIFHIIFPLTCQLLCKMHGAWYRTAGVALGDLFYFAVLSGNSAWQLTFLNKTKLPGEKGCTATTSSAPWWSDREWRSLFVRSPRAFSKSPSPCCIARWNNKIKQIPKSPFSPIEVKDNDTRTWKWSKDFSNSTFRSRKCNNFRNFLKLCIKQI